MLITLNQITKTYRLGEVDPVRGVINKAWYKLWGRSIPPGHLASNGVDIQALKEVSLSIEPGEFVAITGPSGSGKTTLMNIIGCLDQPTSGQYLLEDEEITRLNRNALAHIRNKKIGFVFQNFNLLPRTTSLENAELPLFYGATAKSPDVSSGGGAKRSPDDRRDGDHLTGKQKRQRAIEILNQVGLGDRLYHHPSQLSGGEQQRVAIARAFINHPALILADEPTGNLDSKTGQEIMSLFQRLNQEGITIILITHEKNIAAYAQRVVQIKDGMIL